MFMNSMDDCHREAGGNDDGTNLAVLWDWDSVQLVANSHPEAVEDAPVKARDEEDLDLDPHSDSVTTFLEAGREADSSSDVGLQARSVVKRPRGTHSMQQSSSQEGMEIHEPELC